MAEWATLKAKRVMNQVSGSLVSYLLIGVFGCLMARANILSIYPFAIAYIAVLALDNKKYVIPGLLGVIIGILSVQNTALFAQLLPGMLLSAIIIPKFKDKQGELYILPLLTALFSFLSGTGSLWIEEGFRQEALIFLTAQSALSAGFAIIFYFALKQKDCLFKGSFNGEQGLVWVLTLAILLSGLQGLTIGHINIQIVVLGFFILYIADRFGAGTAAGAGAIFGFLLRWKFGIDNLIDAGIFGLLGFICGGFRTFGKIGLTLSYTSVVLMVTFFVNEGFITSHLYSTALGLLFFLILPSKKKEKTFDRNRIMPEIETTVSKVKTLSQIFDQLSYSFQAAGLESKLRPEVPELMNVLVERVCKNCTTVNYCWEREFYRTYNFMFDLLVYQETEADRDEISLEDLPPEWKKYCSRLQEMIIAARFIMEQQKDREVWQKRLALNREALAEQYKSVSQVIGHLARELHSKHNIEGGKPLVWSRHHRQKLDIGVGSFIKTGNGISGDNYNFIPLSQYKSAVLVCDGMGVGEEAARMSSAALTILEQLLSTGFEPEGAVKALNSILVLRSPEESFVTVDMTVLDLEAHSASMIKIGAAPTYIISKDRVETIVTSSLPAGILNDIDIPVIDVAFRDQILVIVTDGILDVVKGEGDWLREYLENTRLTGSQELAGSIIEEAIRLAGGYLEDDGVVLVVKRKESEK